MRDYRQWVEEEEDEVGANRQTASLAALAVTLLLVVASMALIGKLQHTAVIEDCLLSGRTNCGPEIVLTMHEPLMP